MKEKNLNLYSILWNFVPKKLLVHLTLTLIALATIAPPLFILITSFKPNPVIVQSQPRWVFTPTLQHYQAVLFRGEFAFPHYLKNSVFVSFGSSLMAILISLPAAYSFARFKTGGENLPFTILSIRIAPPVVFAVPFYLLLRSYGMLDTAFGLILAYLTFNIPFSVFILRSFIRDIPTAIEESALIDGANRYQILFRIILPLVAPGMAATFFINLIFSWNEFLFAYFLTTSDATTLTVAIMKFVTAYSIKWGNITAATVLAMVPLIVAGIFMQNYLVRGLTLGAVKR